MRIKIRKSDDKKSILEILQKKNILITAPCNGKGTCKKCQIRFVKNATAPTKEDMEIFSESELANGMRLACRAFPVEDCEIEVPDLYKEEIQVAGVKEKQLEKKQSSQSIKIGTEAYGFAVDIGTTTITALMVKLSDGEILRTVSGVNHQRSYGADVITRIQTAVEGKTLELQECIREDLKSLFCQLLKQESAKPEQIKRIVIAANTTMCHLLLNYPCDTLGVAPFTPYQLSMVTGKAEQVLGLDTWGAEVTILPGVSAFIGGDILSGLHACEVCKKKEPFLFLDIGTNSEMVLSDGTKLWATSAAAGPVFEGGQIEAGVASVPGAISKVSIQVEKNRLAKEKEYQVKLQTIENKPALGICGTGMIEAVAELAEHHLIDENGTFADEAQIEEGFLLTDHIRITQKDIREIQMGKSAIRAGIDTLIKVAGIDILKIQKFYLAGGFGYQINPQKAAGIGMFPMEIADKATAVGNTSLSGAVRFLLGEDCSEDYNALLEKITEINLAMEPLFTESYLENMFFKKT